MVFSGSSKFKNSCNSLIEIGDEYISDTDVEISLRESIASLSLSKAISLDSPCPTIPFSKQSAT